MYELAKKAVDELPPEWLWDLLDAYDAYLDGLATNWPPDFIGWLEEQE